MRRTKVPRDSRGWRRSVPLVLVSLASFLAVTPAAEAYVGPGAGFAFVASFFVLFITILLALFSIAAWPVRYLYRSLRRGRAYTKSKIDKLFVIGLDGLDPDLTNRFMADGKLANFERLKELGSYVQLGTTCPAISPVAWSSFQTGTNPGRHNIFDFLASDRRTYLPDLSSARIGRPTRSLSIGRYSIPLSKPQIKLLRKSKPFWNILGEHGVFGTIIRVPITFPPERFNGLLLSAMCVPDLKGSQGTFSFYTSADPDEKVHTGGTQIPVTVNGNRIESFISGPQNPLARESEELRIPFSVTLNRDRDEAQVEICGQQLDLRKGQYSQWVKLSFRAGLRVKVRGICRFYLKQVSPDFELYVSPINIDPEKPALPISHPYVFAIYLSKLLGSYATLGLAEDTWALNERVIDETAFLDQCYAIHDERERMLLNSLDKVKKGVCICVFDITDRVQHTFWRYLDDSHPANAGKDTAVHKSAIEDLYSRMDDLIGRVMDKVDDRTVLIVLSDHGFKPFRRGVNLNSWLYLNGYLALKDGAAGQGWFENVDWDNTRAYALGLGGLYVNQRGREARGIVPPGRETEELKAELMKKLAGLKDDQNGQVAVNTLFDSANIYSGVYRENAPDLIVGYNEGYRASWESVTGGVTEAVFEDNVKSWSGDHCIDPRLVPGVLFCNRKIEAESPHIVDIAPTALELFGIQIPPYMDGKPLFRS